MTRAPVPGFCKRALEGPAHDAADEVRDRVRQEGAAEEIGQFVGPLHDHMLLSKRSRIALRRACFTSDAEDVIDAVGVGLGAQVAHGVDGEGDVESLLDAWRAVASTPVPVATPTITTWVTPSALSRVSRSVLANAPHVRFVHDDVAGSAGRVRG